MNLILKTAGISLFVQIVIACIGLYGISLSIPSDMYILKELLIMETIVQIIELVYYVWLIQNFTSIHYDVTFTRYFDWIFSTPIMLISTVLYMKYRNTNRFVPRTAEESTTIQVPTIPVSQYMQQTTDEKANKTTTSSPSSPSSSNSLQFLPLLIQNASPILWILGFNWIMLLFGFLGERQILSRMVGFIWGTVFFVASFAIIYAYFVGSDMKNQFLFWFMFVIWGLYGVAYLFSYTTKNVLYNFLDVFSKNFYGLFLFVEIRRASLSKISGPQKRWIPTIYHI